MKIRNGFVSNSSSSSYIIFIKRRNIIKLEDLPEWCKENRFEDHSLWTLREGGCDGDWVRCRIDADILQVLLEHSQEDEKNFIDILIDPFWIEDDCWGFRSSENLPKDLSDFNWGFFDIDMHGPKTVKDWKEYFELQSI